MRRPLLALALLVATILACTSTATPETIRVASAENTVSAPSATAFQKCPILHVTAPEGLNLRKFPNSSSDVIAVLYLGDEVHDLGGRVVSKDGLHWCQVEHDRLFGWAWCEWLE